MYRRVSRQEQAKGGATGSPASVPREGGEKVCLLVQDQQCLHVRPGAQGSGGRDGWPSIANHPKTQDSTKSRAPPRAAGTPWICRLPAGTSQGGSRKQPGGPDKTLNGMF